MVATGSVRAKAFEIFDLLPLRKQSLVYELIISMMPDDIATPELISRHETAMAEFRQGETVDHENIDWS